MAFEIFGYEISKKKDKAPQAAVVTPVTPRDDGASIVYSSDSGSYGAAAGYYGYQFDLDGVVRNESQMINQYRTVACFPEVDGAIEAIVNDAVIIEQGRDPVSLNLDGLPKQYHPLRDTIREHFDHVLNVLNFNDNCHDIFKRWYIDGRLYYYVMIDPKNPKKGIVDLKYIDPRKIRKVIEYQRENRNGIDVIVGQKSYYIFNDAGLQSAALGVKLSTDSIINVRSGLVDANTGEVISHLFKGIKPANQLKMMEDALVIYRITRAPERRVFYVDVGNLPGLKAEQYVNNVMNKFRNKVVYDAETGEVKNNRNYMSVCFTMDTKVRLVDGRVLTLDEMSRLYQTEDLEVYSCDPDTGHRTIGKVQWAGVTGYNRDVMTLTLSNGCNVTCTPDHRFVVQKGGFVEAKDLSVGEQLLTLSDECCTVVSKQACEDRCDVGCLRVDNEYHTFALDADVFVHNCEDFFLPRREGGKATEIQTLPGCLAMDTKVSLLDGRELSIHDIEHEMKQGKQLWTYSCHPETGKVVPGLITWAGVTQKSAKVMKLTLDNGETITCTPDHKFPIKDVGFVRADQLKVNDSLIPLYRRHAQIDSNYKNTYEQYYDNESHEWYFTHRKVVEYVQGLEEFADKRVVHHVDLNRYNNDPSNLKQMGWQEHRKLHSDMGFAYKERMFAEGRGDEWLQWKKDLGHYVWNSKSDEQKAQLVEALGNGREAFKQTLKDNGEWEDYCKKFVHCGIKAQLVRKEQMKDEDWHNQFKLNCKRAQNQKDVREAREVFYEQNMKAKIDDVIAEFAFDFLSTHRKGQEPAIGLLCDALNSDPSMVKRYVQMNQGKKGNIGKTQSFVRAPLKCAICDYYGCKDWKEFVAKLTPTINNNFKLHIDGDIAKLIVDICKQPVKHAVSAKRVAPILNSYEWVQERMVELNGNRWRGRFYADNVAKMICDFYGFESWKQFKENYKYLNHRIVAIQWLDDPIEVGTLTIDIDEIYHNYHTFALSCGVFTKNSQNLSEIADIEYFQKKLYQSLNVPRQRLLNDNVMSIGNPNEVTREELAFAKFIQRLRNRFNVLFKEALRIQLITTNCIRQSDWEKIRNCIYFEYQHDNYFEELKRIEVFNERMTQLQTADGFKGIYFSKEYIVRNILEMTQEEWEEIQQQMKQEKIDEAREAAELENANAGDQEGDEQFDQDSSEGEGDDGYNDFVSGNDSAPEEVDQEGDTTDTIDDTAEPNPGEDDFDRPATPGLKATM